jgi:MFS family permease
MSFQPASSLRSRTFIGLVVAQFLAAFNDQAIHASAMFFAIHQRILSEENAISLMPVLFYAPWAIFCTLAGYLADRYSKRSTLVFWKIAEIGITGIALLGFWANSALGAWMVLSTVFLMGTHSAFFVPAKYGVMPEILPPHLLSKGNGVLESLSFLAVILGTYCGGELSYVFKGQEYWIGVVLLSLAVVGALASALIEKVPAANPTRPFPRNLFKPLWVNLGTLLRSRPLLLAVLGIAFFTFVVAFMRGTMYMHGETRNPRWTERETSIMVAVVALGIGLGSPLAGFLSGGKIELGLVPLGALGMIVTLLTAAFVLNSTAALVACLVAIGFFTGFYIVPLFTLLQHRAPKKSKGDLLASSNFINVVGAITASLLFKGLLVAATWTGITPMVTPTEVARGILAGTEMDEHGRPSAFTVWTGGGEPTTFGSRQEHGPDDEEPFDRVVVESAGDPTEESEVVVARYVLTRQGRDVLYYRVQPADLPLAPAYDKEPLTRYLFLGAALLTLLTLTVLCVQLPDFFVRMLICVRSWGRYRLRVYGVEHLPTDGAVLLATNCDRFDQTLLVWSSTDRYTPFVLLENGREVENGARAPLLHLLARYSGLTEVPLDQPEGAAWEKALRRAAQALARGRALGVSADGDGAGEVFWQRLRRDATAPVLPVYCDDPADGGRRVRVIIGPALGPGASLEEIRARIAALRDERSK